MQNRRKFLAQTLTASTGLFLDNFAALAETPLSFTIPADFSLKMLATSWGFPGTIDEFCAKAKKAGYDGIEVWAPTKSEDRYALNKATQANGLEVGFLVGSSSTDFKEHFTQFIQALKNAAALKPLYINCHSGKDYFTLEQAQNIIELSITAAKVAGIPLYHETHRGRICYSAPITRTLLERIPGMRLTLDISHWCVVHESLLADQKDTVDLALSRTDHIHARVGHQEGPQVTDPRAPEWADALKAHLAWWDKVVEMKVAQNQPMTILTEFGPPMYLPTVPYTRQPLADQWAINVHMMELLRSRYLVKK
ncbi:sugar phosphate isomerase/epimerase family protein [Haliscomenobacter hydrossis]|uniref:Xylose isomerase domain-containing protein TIM barrel n=1 Tax=Haliscomenobacter hydrossis (strain ATCC 27775 / DSM 1100 / LMG 10767 / O) TaxID=760192 RepID=F4KW13_HALH1|nr:TIM barrel protein [Haliscomenobacter hydrossis]AEE48211.1 Xylose isomerase domain-containing protein TIM barrel [Haliscomenobacter hydrossis DSM 1100]